MTLKTFGYVDSYNNLKKLPPGAFDMVQVDKQKDGLDVLDKKETSVPLLHPNGGIFTWDKNAEDSEDGHDIITPNSTPSKGRWKRLVDNLSVKWFGAKGDMNQHYVDDTDGIVTRYRGEITSGNNELRLTSQSDIDTKDHGKTIVIWKPGLKDGYFVSKIKEVNLDGLKSVVLENSPRVSISDAYIAWGTDDTDAIQKAIDIAERTGLAVYLPPGRYIVTKTLTYNTIEPQRDAKDSYRYWPNYPYLLMKPGLQMFGAGLQVSFIHSLIENDIDKSNATIKLDGTGGIHRINFQQTGQLKDFSISSIGYFEGTQLTKGIKGIGIDLRATWAYTIENVAIMNMGSDGIIIRNLRVEGGTSDYDQTDKLRLDNVLVFANYGWGIKVDAAEAAVSTSKIHFDRCKIEENEGGGIQWTGLGGVIERCGIYGNGVYPKNDPRSKTPEKPTAIEGAYGILIKNVKSTSDGLLITGCEIQGNADVQVMVQVGSNIKIVQNDFKVDNLGTHFSFPSLDIQVGDANLGDLHIDYYSTDDKKSIILDALPDPYPLDETEYDSNIIELYGTRKPTKSIELIFPVAKVMEWLLVNHTDVYVRPKGRSADGSETPLAMLWPFSEKSIRVLEKEVKEGGHKIKKLVFEESFPRTVNACVIEDNSIRLSWEGKAWGGDIAPAHTVVKVNSNAVGTMIRGWWRRTWISSDVEGKYKLVDLVESDPLTHTRLPIYPMVFPGKTHANTNLHCDGIDGGHVLHPFAYHQPHTFVKQMETYTPDTSRWSYYRFVIDGKGNTMSLIIANPTTRTIGSPLFLEFINGRNEYVRVKFGTEYKVGESLDLPPGKTVSGILLFEVAGTWTSFSPWTCDGKPL